MRGGGGGGGGGVGKGQWWGSWTVGKGRIKDRTLN